MSVGRSGAANVSGTATGADRPGSAEALPSVTRLPSTVPSSTGRSSLCGSPSASRPYAASTAANETTRQTARTEETPPSPFATTVFTVSDELPCDGGVSRQAETNGPDTARKPRSRNRTNEIAPLRMASLLHRSPVPDGTRRNWKWTVQTPRSGSFPAWPTRTIWEDQTSDSSDRFWLCPLFGSLFSRVSVTTSQVFVSRIAFVWKGFSLHALFAKKRTIGQTGRHGVTLRKGGTDLWASRRGSPPLALLRISDMASSIPEAM
jgi:hypothetical protein